MVGVYKPTCFFYFIFLEGASECFLWECWSANYTYLYRRLRRAASLPPWGCTLAKAARVFSEIFTTGMHMKPVASSTPWLRPPTLAAFRLHHRQAGFPVNAGCLAHRVHDRFIRSFGCRWPRWSVSILSMHQDCRGGGDRDHTAARSTWSSAFTTSLPTRSAHPCTCRGESFSSLSSKPKTHYVFWCVPMRTWAIKLLAS